jgi:hypothetical protein
MSTPSWEEWEQTVQRELGLDATICSGNQFHDQGDAKDNTNPRDDDFRLMVDCKYTDNASFSVSKKIRQFIDLAAESGKRGILAIRLWPRGQLNPEDFVVLTFDDFQELLAKAKEPRYTIAVDEPSERKTIQEPLNREPRCPNAGKLCFCTGLCQKPVPGSAHDGPNFNGWSTQYGV